MKKVTFVQISQKILSSEREGHKRQILYWRWPLCSVHSVMMVFSAQLAEGGGARPPSPLEWCCPLHPLPSMQDQQDIATCTFPHRPSIPFSRVVPFFFSDNSVFVEIWGVQTHTARGGHRISPEFIQLTPQNRLTHLLHYALWNQLWAVSAVPTEADG